MAEYLESIQVEVTGNIAKVAGRPSYITSGSVGLPVEFTFDSRWEGLDKVAVFKAGGVSRTMELPDVKTTVPWEVLEKSGLWLNVGVYGVNADGSVAIPTIWAKVSIINPGAEPSSDQSLDPTLPVWKELQNAVGDTAELKTEAKENLVVAVNEVYGIAKAGTHYDLLDNSYFINPVNQRGLTRYTSGYCIDRWVMPVNATVNLTDDGLQLVASASGQCSLWQKIEKLKDSVFTFAVCDSDGKVYVVSGRRNIGNTPWGSIGFDEHISGYYYCSIVVNKGNTKTFRWAALYEGEYTAETLPAYQPKGYGVEMAECLRYFYRYPNKNEVVNTPYGIGTASGNYRVGMLFRLPVPMRTAPTVVASGRFMVTSSTWTPTADVTNIWSSEKNSDMVVLVVDVASWLTSGETYLLQGNQDSTAHIDFSADL